MAEEYLEIEEPKEDNLAVGAKGGAIAVIFKISSMVLGFLNQIILARILGAGGIGEVLLVLSVVNVSAQFARFGMEEAMMRFIPSYIEKRDNAKLKGTIYFVLKFCLLLSILFVFLVILLSKFISINVFHSEGLLKLLPIVAIAIPASVIRGVIGGILKGHRDIFKALLPELLISPFFRIAIFLLLTLQGVSTLHAIVAFIIGEIFAVVLSIIFLVKELNKIEPVKQQYENKKVLGVAYTMIFASFGAYLYTQADLWILGMFRSTEEVGIYGVSAKLVTLILFSMAAFATIIPPLISKIHISGNRDELIKVVSGSTRWVLSIAIPITLILVLEGKFILKYFFGEIFVNGYIPLVILSIGQIIKAGTGLVGYILQMTGQHKTFLKITISGGISNIILNILLVPYFGMLGAAIATTLCFTMVNIICVFVIYKRLTVLTLAKGLKFDIIFIAVVAILYFLLNYNNFYLGYHILLIGALIVYIWKLIANDDLPWRLLFTKYKSG